MTKALLPAILLLFICSVASAQTLDIQPGIVTRADSLKAVLTLKDPLPGNGTLTLIWTDCWGRTVARESQAVKAADKSVPIALPLARAVAMQNFLEAELRVGDTIMKAPRVDFVVTPSDVWDDYQIIQCFPYKTADMQWALRDVGFTGGEIASKGTQNPMGAQAWWSYDFRFYCDQIAKSFYAAYHTPAQNPKNKALLDAKALYRKDRTSKAAFFRNPSLSDPEALAAATGAVKKAVESQMRFKPFFYTETDEGGVAELVTAWDFDFSPPALEAMRQWLLGQYGSLEAINKEWGTTFAKMEDVVPLSTDEMMARQKSTGDGNFSPWADHRYFMNKSYADAVLASAKAGHAVDKDALVGLEGCQMPAAFGGYDYWLLSQSMDCIEPYNIGNSRDVWRSLAPGKPAVTTSFGFGDSEIWRLWYQALRGDQGTLVYDEKHSYLDADGKPTPSALKILPTYKELTGGIVKQLHYARRIDDPIAIHYSQPSITAQWMIEVLPAGRNWIDRASSSERRDSDFLRLRESWTKLVEDGMHQYNFVAYAQLENGDFDKSGAKVLILPQSIAMSERECKGARDFVDRGGTLIADCRTALMDGHCRMLDKGQLDDLFGIERSNIKFAPGPAGLKPVDGVKPAIEVPGALDKVAAAEPGIKAVGGAVALYHDANNTPAVIVMKHGKGTTIYLNALVTDYHRWRLKPPEGDGLLALVSNIIRNAGIGEEFDLSAGGKSVAGIQVVPFASGDLKMLAVIRNYELRVNELGPPEYQKQNALEQPLDLTVRLGGECAVYDTRAGKFLGMKDAVTFSLGNYQPTILAILPAPVEALKVEAPAEAAGGDLVEVKLSLLTPKPGDMHAFHVTLTGPDGKEVRALTRNLLAPKGQASLRLPIAVSDPAGDYVLTARDAATGVTGEHKFKVK